MPAGSNASPTRSAPEMSVVLVVAGQRERGARALASVLVQDAIDRIEVLIVDLSPPEASALSGSDHPSVRLLRCGPAEVFTSARALGVREARAPVVAFIEEHCEARPGWARALIETHREDVTAVGCSFEIGNPGSGSSDVCFHLSHGEFVPHGKDRGPSRFLSGHNSSYKRDVLLGYGDRLEELLMCDTVLHFRLHDDGHRLFYEPAACLAHHNENSLRSVAVGVFYWNWCFGYVRARDGGWSMPRRLVWAAAMPLMPIVRWLRLLRLRWGDRPARQHLLRETPFFLAASYSSALGQALGVFFNAENAGKRFSDFEMNEPRLLREEWEAQRKAA